MSDYHTGLFWRVWWKRSRIERDVRFRQQMLACRIAWRPILEIEDLSDPHGKRLLFGGSRETTKDTLKGSEPF